MLCQVQHALSLVGMEKFQNRTTHTLSGGQKQRVAIAGALAESPKVWPLIKPVPPSAAQLSASQYVTMYHQDAKVRGNMPPTAPLAVWQLVVCTAAIPV